MPLSCYTDYKGETPKSNVEGTLNRFKYEEDNEIRHGGSGMKKNWSTPNMTIFFHHFPKSKAMKPLRLLRVKNYDKNHYKGERT